MLVTYRAVGEHTVEARGRVETELMHRASISVIRKVLVTTEDEVTLREQ